MSDSLKGRIFCQGYCGGTVCIKDYHVVEGGEKFCPECYGEKMYREYYGDKL